MEKRLNPARRRGCPLTHRPSHTIFALSTHAQTPLTLTARFQGMAAALVSDEPGAREVGEAAGMAWHPLCTRPGSADFPPLPPPDALAARLRDLLALREPAVGGEADEDDASIDLVLLQAPAPPAGADPDTAAAAAAATLAWVDALLAAVARLPGARAGLVTGVILGGDGVPLPTPGGGPVAPSASAASLPPLARPAQTFELACASDTLRPARAFYLAARCPGVMRTDSLDAIDPAGAVAGGVHGATALAHLLPELAYKMGRAPKYGA